MDIEGDKLVYDYLGRVADLAQVSLSADERARLVAGLRADIDEKRAGTRDSPAAVRRVLARLGEPDQVVRRATTAGVPVPRSVAAAPGPATGPSVPVAPPEPPEPAAPEPGSGAPTAPAPQVVPDWWRVPGTPAAAVPEAASDSWIPVYPAENFPGWHSVEIGFGQRRPPAAPQPPAPGAPPDGAGLLPEPRKPKAQPAAAPRRRFAGVGRPLLLEALAALLLLVGAVIGSLIPMLLGWLAAYASRRMTRLVRKFAVLGIPALAVLAAALWLWGRNTGRWGGPPPTDEQFQDSVKSLVPVVLRGASAASAAFLAWFSFRRRGTRG